MFISQMEDSHLINTIRLILRNVDKAKHALGSTINIDPASAAMYGIDTKAMSTRAKESIRPYIQLLYPYVTEAALRGLNVTGDLQSTIGRTERESRFVDAKMLLGRGDDFEDLEDYLDEHDFLND